MKKQKVYIVTEIYQNELSTDVNVIGVSVTDSKAGKVLAERKKKIIETFERDHPDDYDISEDHPTLFEASVWEFDIWVQLKVTEKIVDED